VGGFVNRIRIIRDSPDQTGRLAADGAKKNLCLPPGQAAISAVVCVVLLLTLGFQARDDAFLDLTKAKPSGGRTDMRGRGITTIGTPDTPSSPKKTPLRITLLSLNATTYRLGDQATYDVRLTNISREDLIIPWMSTELEIGPDQADRGDAYVNATLKLEIVDSGFIAAAVVGIHGSKSVRGSTRILRPGHSVRIRAQGLLSASSQDVNRRLLAKLPKTFEVRAMFYFYNQPVERIYEPAIPANSLKIALRRRES
jgi:hypothetical protein